MTFQYTAHKSLCSVLAMLFSCGLLAQTQAGPFAGLATTPEAFSGTILGVSGQNAGAWQNAESVAGVNFGVSGFEFTSEYAVFAPGPGFGNFLGGPDPTGGTEWVYAFQVRLDGNSFGTGLDSLLAGFDLGASVTTIGSVPGTGDEATSSEFFNATSAQWRFTPASFGIGDVSDIVYYTSPFAPKRDKVTSRAGSFADSGESSVDGFASPSRVIPEPATIFLMVVCGGTALLRRERN